MSEIFLSVVNNTDVAGNEEGYAAACNNLQHENRTLNTYQCILISSKVITPALSLINLESTVT